MEIQLIKEMQPHLEKSDRNNCQIRTLIFVIGINNSSQAQIGIDNGINRLNIKEIAVLTRI
jgi:hypothetical protein